MLDDLETPLRELIEDEKCDLVVRDWLTAIVLSLRTAQALDYTEDTYHAKYDTKARIAIHTRLLETESLLGFEPTSDGEREWLRGYFFNSALMRISALHERGLRRLSAMSATESELDPLRAKRRNRPAPPWEDFGVLQEWFTKRYLGGSEKMIEHLKRTRSQTNKFRHEPKAVALDKLSSMKDAVRAVSELLSLLRETVKGIDQAAGQCASTETDNRTA